MAKLAHLLTRDTLTVPKNRKPKFELKLRIIDLTNVPLVCGTSYVRWHLPSSTAAEHRGHTDRAVIQDHRASWDYEKILPVKMTIDRNHMLQECDICFEIFQEFSSGSRGDRITLGNIKLNLAEYVDRTGEDDEEGIIRRYLMQDSKINSTLKVGILMRQIDGEKNFITPPLKTAMVFGGIAGIMPSDAGDHDDNLGSVPTINISRETGDLQDMYRRTLAASWTCRGGELPPDQLIEDLFAGGTGYSSSAGGSKSRSRDGFEEESDADPRRTIQSNRLSPNPEKRPKSSSSYHSRVEGKRLDDGGSLSSSSGVSGNGNGSRRRSLEHHIFDSRDRERRWRGSGDRDGREVSEFDVRDDLRTWEISVED